MPSARLPAATPAFVGRLDVMHSSKTSPTFRRKKEHIGFLSSPVSVYFLIILLVFLLNYKFSPLDLSDQAIFSKLGNMCNDIADLDTELELQKDALVRIEDHAKVK